MDELPSRPAALLPAVLLLCAPLLSPAPLTGQADTVRPDADTLPPAAAGLPSDTTPLPSDAAGAGDGSPWIARGAGFAMLVASDLGIRRTVQELRSGRGALLGGEDSFGDEVAEFGNGLGAWKTSLPWLAAGPIAVGAAVDGMRGAGRGLSILGGIAAGTMANSAVNRLVGRSRPAWGEGAFSFDPFSGHASFPSGHVSLAFSVAGGVDAVTEGWLPAAAAYTVAGTTAFARVYSDRHWLSDVVVGAVLSATVSRLATRRTMDLLGVERGAPGTGRGRRVEEGASARLLLTPSRIGVQLRF